MKKRAKVLRKKIPERSEDDFFPEIHITVAQIALARFTAEKAGTFVYG